MCRLFVRSDAEAAEILHHVVDLLLLHDLGLLLLPLHLLRHRSIDHLKKLRTSSPYYNVKLSQVFLNFT